MIKNNNIQDEEFRWRLFNNLKILEAVGKCRGTVYLSVKKSVLKWKELCLCV